MATEGQERISGTLRTIHWADTPSVAPFPDTHTAALSSPHRVVVAAAAVRPLRSHQRFAPAPHRRPRLPRSWPRRNPLLLLIASASIVPLWCHSVARPARS